MENSRPVGQVDKHILLLVHGVGNAGMSPWSRMALDETGYCLQSYVLAGRSAPETFNESDYFTVLI